MSGSKRISELSVTTALSGNDRVVVLTNPASSAQTQTITLTSLTNSLRIANTSVSGVVKVGNNLSVNSTGFLNVQTNNLTANSLASGNSLVVLVPNSSGDGAGFSTIQLIPETGYPDQKIIVDPTAPNHIHIRAGGPQDNSAASLYLGGENSYFNIGYGSNPPASVSANGYMWEFDTTGNLHFPNNTIVIGQGMGPTIVSNTSLFLYSYFDDTVNNNIEYYQGSISYPNTYQIFSQSYSNSGLNTVAIALDNTDQKATIQINGSNSWSFFANGGLQFPDLTVQNTAYQGPTRVTAFVTSTPHNANSSEEIILCDPNAAAANIVINLPVPTANGRVFTIKNLNDGGSNVYHVEVYANNGSSVIEMHGVGVFNTSDLVASSGDTVTWVYYDGYYRVINYG